MATSTPLSLLPLAGHAQKELGVAPPYDRRFRPRRLARAWIRWITRLEPDSCRAARRLVVIICLSPLIVILAHSALRLDEDPLLLSYGIAALSTTISIMYIAFAHYQDPSETGASRSKPARMANTDWRAGAEAARLPYKVTCLVSVKDEVDEIEQCVRSMLASDYPDLEVIVIDDGSSDGTPEVLRLLAAGASFTLIELAENVGKKRALTIGARCCGGDILVFTDSDCVLAPDAISRCVAAFMAHPDLGAVSGHARALNADQNLLTRAQDVWYDGQFRVAKAAESAFGSVTCVSGPLAAFRREAVYNYLPAWANDRFLGKPFRFSTDRQLTGYVLGQRWIGARLKRRFADSPFVKARDHPERYWRVEYVRAARVWTNVPASFRAFVRQQVRWKKSFIRNLCFTGRFAWRRGLGPAALYYGHALWVVAAPFMAARHLLWMPLHGLWLFTLLYLCGVLLKGSAWAIAYRIDNPGCSRWVYRPVMSLCSSVVLPWFLIYAALTIRKPVWSRGTQ